MSTVFSHAKANFVIGAMLEREWLQLPDVVNSYGAEAPSQSLVVPPGVNLLRCLLPGTDVPDQEPDHRLGPSLIGTRAPAVGPYLSTSSTALLNLRLCPCSEPASFDEILAWLRERQGTSYAPGALVRLFGWSDENIAIGLDHLRVNGAGAQLLVGALQATFVLRQFWERVEQPATSARQLVLECGIIPVLRGIGDCVLLVAQQNQQTASAKGVNPRNQRAMSALVEALGCLQQMLDDALNGGDPARCRRALKTLYAVARRILYGLQMFVLNAGPGRKSWFFLERALKKLTSTSHVSSAASQSSAAMVSAAQHSMAAIEQAIVQHHIGGSIACNWTTNNAPTLDRLMLNDQSRRLSYLGTFRSDLAYKLIVTQRLDRVHQLFSWFSVACEAFPGCVGGFLGAVSTLLEIGRIFQITRELRLQALGGKASTLLPPKSTPSRLTVKTAVSINAAQPNRLQALIQGGAGAHWYDASAISHGTVMAVLAGKSLTSIHPLKQAQQGKLAGSMLQAMHDPATAKTVADIHDEMLAPLVTTPDEDVPRFLGRNAEHLLSWGLVRCVPMTARHRGTADHIALMVNAERRTSGVTAGPSIDLHLATLNAVLTMMASLADEHALSRKNSVLDAELDAQSCGTKAADLKLKLASLTTPFAGGDPRSGQGLHRSASKKMKAERQRDGDLQTMMNNATMWHSKAVPQLLLGAEQRLHDLLSGRGKLHQIQPVADLVNPVLWLCPFIDRDRISSIAHNQIPTMAPSGQINANLTRAVEHNIQLAHDWAASLFRHRLVTPQAQRVACHLFTGLGSITGDLAHPRGG